MIKDFLISFKDNISDKTKNPFLGTYLLVWIVRNWELIYSVFNFDTSFNLKNRINYITSYYKTNNFIENLLTNIYWAFGLLVLTYILLNISRLIVNFFDKKLTPWIYKITDDNSIVLKTEYDRVRLERDDLQTRLDLERESKSRLEIRIKNLEQEILNISEVKVKSISEKNIGDNSKSINNENNINTLLSKLKQKDLVTEFTKLAVLINKGDYVSNDYLAKDYFIEMGLITFRSNHFDGYSKSYNLTQDGEDLLRLLRYRES